MQKNYRFSLSKKILFWLQSEARFEGTIWFQQKAPPVLGVNLTPPPPSSSYVIAKVWWLRMAVEKSLSL